MYNSLDCITEPLIMKKPSIPKNDDQRVLSLKSYDILDSHYEQEFDDITYLASQICQTKISLISLVDKKRQWFKSKYGLEAAQTSRDLAYCAHAINEPNSMLEVHDATKDERFIGNPLLEGAPYARFYAGIPLVNDEGFALGTLCVINDKPKKLKLSQIKALRILAHQVVAMMELRKQKKHLEFFESAFQESSEGFAWLNKNAELVNFNQKYCDLTGFDRVDLDTKRVYEFDTNFTQETWESHWDEMLEKKALQFETNYQGKDGLVRTVELRLKMVENNSGNLISAIVLDISKKKESQLKFVENSYFLEEVQSIAKIGYWELNLVKKTVYWSEETRRIHEVDPDYVPELETGIDFYDESSRPIITEKVNNAIENGEGFDVQLRIITAKNKPKWVRSVGKVQFENGIPLKMVGVFQDIDLEVTLREDLRAKRKLAEQASEAKHRFLSAMSHEIRTPLNAIIGSSYMLSNKNPNESQLEYLNILNKGSAHLMSLVNNVLDLEKIEDGKAVLETIDFNLKELASNTFKSWQLLANDKGLDSDLNYDEHLLSIYQGDPTKLRQVLNNLLSNAIKFTDTGFVKMTLRAEKGTAGRHRIKFIIEDSGIGIHSDQLKSVFNEFVQADKSITRKYGGTGLGLSITDNLLRLMGSKIQVQSVWGIGASFSFALEMNEGEDQHMSPKSAINLLLSEKILEDRVVLLVEDNEFNSKIAKDFLETWGAIVVSAFNGQEALALIGQKAFDLVLMDLQMPILDGYSATRKIREMKGGYFKTVPIIAVTASALVSSKQKVLDAGMNDFITKPLDPNEFYQKIAVFTGKKVRENETRFTVSLDYFRVINKSTSSSIKEYLDLFERGIRDDKSSVTVALNESDVSDLMRVLHKNKSALKALGLDLMTSEAEFLEQELTNNVALNELADRIETFFDHDMEEILHSINKIKKFYN